MARSNTQTLRVMTSSKAMDWGTPQKLFDRLNTEFGFTLDVCASASNKKCDRYFSIADNGLLQDWQGVCWMNPPYGAEVGNWMEKARDSAMAGSATVVCLVPARTDTRWWHETVIYADEVRFVRGRIVFQGATHNAPFACVIVVFKANLDNPVDQGQGRLF